MSQHRFGAAGYADETTRDAEKSVRCDHRGAREVARMSRALTAFSAVPYLRSHDEVDAENRVPPRARLPTLRRRASRATRSRRGSARVGRNDGGRALDS